MESLIQLVQRNDVAGLRQRLTAVPPDEADESGWTPVHWAALLGRSLCLEMLIGAGADVNRQSVAKETPLHLVEKELSDYGLQHLLRSMDSRAIMRILTSAGLRPEKDIETGCFLLQQACLRFWTKEIESLAMWCANINAVHPSNGNTTLYCLILGFRNAVKGKGSAKWTEETEEKLNALKSLVKLLRDIGLKMSAFSEDPVSGKLRHALVKVCSFKSPKLAEEVVKLLLRHGCAPTPGCLKVLIKKGNMDVLKTCADYGVDFDVVHTDPGFFSSIRTIEIARFIIDRVMPRTWPLSARKEVLIKLFRQEYPDVFHALVEEGSFFVDCEQMIFEPDELPSFVDPNSTMVERPPSISPGDFGVNSLQFGFAYSLLGCVIRYWGHRALETIEAMFAAGITFPESDLVAPEMFAAVEFYIFHPLIGRQEGFTLFDLLEKHGFSHQYNALFKCKSEVLWINPGEKKWTPVAGGIPVSQMWKVAPPVLMMAVNDLQVLFEVLKRGGRVDLIMRNWMSINFDKPKKREDHWLGPDHLELQSRGYQKEGRFIDMALIMAFVSRDDMKIPDVKDFARFILGSRAKMLLNSNPKWEVLEKMIGTVPTLKSLSRAVCRRSLAGVAFSEAVKHLGISLEAQDFLLFKKESPPLDEPDA